MRENKERNDQIVLLYTEPPYLSVCDLAKDFKISRQAVYVILKRRNVVTDKTSRHKTLKDERDVKVRKLHKNGLSYAEISTELSENFEFVSKSTVARIVNA